jgi:hypothetical protein
VALGRKARFMALFTVLALSRCNNIFRQMKNRVYLFSFELFPYYNASGIFKVISSQLSSRQNEVDGEHLIFPTDVVVDKETKIETKKKFWSAGTKEVSTRIYSYYLVFNKDLTPEQVRLWEMWRIGYFVGQEIHRKR